MAQILHVHTDLMCAACFQMEGKQGAAICFLQDTIMSNGRLSVLKIHHPHDGGVGLPSQRCVYRAGGRKPGSAHDGKIFPLYFTPGGHNGKNTAAYHMLGDDCQTRGISVKPVDASEYERHALG